MYKLQVIPTCEREIKKQTSKNNKLKEELKRKIKQILANPEKFKPLKWPMAGFRRVHVGGVFVLIYRVVGAKVILMRFKHHDEMYK